MNESSAFQLFIFSHLTVIFSFHSERTLHIKKKSSICTSYLSDLMYAHIIKHCLVNSSVAFSRVLRIVTQNESCNIRQLYVVELALGSEYCYDFNEDNCHLRPVLGPSCHRRYRRVYGKFYENKLVEMTQWVIIATFMFGCLFAIFHHAIKAAYSVTMNIFQKFFFSS